MAKLVTESAFQLFNAAESDVNTINSITKDKEVPEEYKNDQICYHATQAVEKFLKGWIIYNKGSVERLHNLDYVWETAFNINNILNSIKNDCLILNKYTSEVRYGSSIPITKDEIKDIRKSLNNVITFAPIQSLRITFKNDDPNYRKLSDKIIEETQQQSIFPTPEQATGIKR